MLRILLDENVPIGLKSLLGAFDVRTADEMGWAGIAVIVVSGLLATLLRARAIPDTPADDH